MPDLRHEGHDYGDNKVLNQMQDSAPLNPQGSGGPVVTGGGGQPRPALGPEGIFGPTNRPGEPITAGIDFGPGSPAPQTVLDEDPDLLLAALARNFPHPELERLLARRRG